MKGGSMVDFIVNSGDGKSENVENEELFLAPPTLFVILSFSLSVKKKWRQVYRVREKDIMKENYRLRMSGFATVG